MNRVWKLALMSAFLLIIDQISKGTVQSTMNFGDKLEVFEGFFRFSYVKNPELAFGMLQDGPDWLKMILTKIIPLFISLWMVYLVWVLRKTNEFLCSFGYALVFTGALGNLLDRWSYGYVVDFIEFYFNDHVFPAFNIADLCLFIAGNVFILDFIIYYINSKIDEGLG